MQITLSLDQAEVTALRQLIDIACRAHGSATAVAVAHFMARLDQAVAAAANAASESEPAA